MIICKCAHVISRVKEVKSQVAKKPLKRNDFGVILGVEIESNRELIKKAKSLN